MSESRYFVLRDDVGVDHADNLEPLAEIGLIVGVPTAVPGPENVEIVEVPQAHSIKPADKLNDERRVRIIPGTRYVETNDALIAEGLLGHPAGKGLFVEVDEPKKADIDKARKETDAHIEAMKNRDAQVQLGNEPAPDATDAAGDGQEG